MRAEKSTLSRKVPRAATIGWEAALIPRAAVCVALLTAGQPLPIVCACFGPARGTDTNAVLVPDERLGNRGAVAPEYEVEVDSPPGESFTRIGYWFMSPSSRPEFLAADERASRAELAKDSPVIPHDDLAIQWDVCQDVLAWEGYFPNRCQRTRSTDPPVGELQGGHHRHARAARQRGAGAGGARLSPLLRDAQRRARRHADRPRQHGRDHARPPRRARAAARVHPRPRAETPRRRGLLRAARRPTPPRVLRPLPRHHPLRRTRRRPAAPHRGCVEDRLRLRHRDRMRLGPACPPGGQRAGIFSAPVVQCHRT